MGMCRIESVFVEDGVDSNDVMVFDGFVDKNGFLKPIKMFGYATDDDKFSPMVIKPNNDKTLGIVAWDDEWADTQTSVNIINRRIKVGEYFTRREIHGNEDNSFTYRITTIFDWGEVSD